MFNRAKKSLEDLTQLDTANYIKMVKKIKEEYDNPSEKFDPVLNSLSKMNNGSTKHLLHTLRHYL